MRQEADENQSGPSEDDLMAIADAVREVALNSHTTATDVSTTTSQSSVGRRGHLRAVPS